MRQFFCVPIELTREEREQVKAHIGEILNGEPVTDAELENLARVQPATFYVIARRNPGIMRGMSADDALRALLADLLEELQSKFRDNNVWLNKGKGDV